MSEFPPRGALSVSFGEACDRGKVREENQDSIRSASISLGDLFIVADGIGGYQGGATASRMVVEGFFAQLAARPAAYPPDHALAEACSYTNASIHAAANAGDPAFQRMGSTVVLALIQDGSASGGATGEVASFGPTAWIGHVGDSRAYLIRGGRMMKLTSDHSAVQALISRNLITEEEARNHPDASVLTRSLGHRPDVEIEIDRVSLEIGDALLLCSDGLWGYVADSDIAAVATDPGLSVEKAAEYLLDLAMTAGGQDNIGIEYIRIGGNASAYPASVPPPVRSASRTTQPEIDTSQFSRPSISGAAFAPASATASSAAEPAAGLGNRSRLLIAAGLLALALCGAAGIAFYRFSGNKTNSDSPNKATSSEGPSSTPNPAPHRHDDSTHGQRPPAPRPSPAPGGNIPAPTPPGATGPKLIGVVGDIQLGDFKPPAPDEVEFKDTKVQKEGKADCVKLRTPETVVYVSNPGQDEQKIIGWIVKHYPNLQVQVDSREVKRHEMTEEVRRGCGKEYDAIVMIAQQPPAPGVADPQTSGPQPTVPQNLPQENPPASQFHRRRHPLPPPRP